jgi:molecular chaperone HscB
MDISQNHFALFALPERMALDGALLDAAFHRVQNEVHPDRFASAGVAAKRLAMQWATRVNEAYRVLKEPLQRARYLCELHGVDLEVESNTRMPAAFLMAQLEWRESLDDAKAAADAEALDQLLARLTVEFSDATSEIAQLIDGQHDFAAAGQAVRRLMFLDKTRDDVERAIDALIV